MAPLSVAEVLERAADLIEPEGAWTWAAGARDNHGTSVKSFAKSAVCWCMEGAVAAILRREWSSRAFMREPAYAVLREAIKDGGFNGDPYRWNDDFRRTQAEVVAKLREAAELARARSAEFGNIGADGKETLDGSSDQVL